MCLKAIGTETLRKDLIPVPEVALRCRREFARCANIVQNGIVMQFWELRSLKIALPLLERRSLLL